MGAGDVRVKAVADEPDVAGIDAQQGGRGLEEQGAWLTNRVFRRHDDDGEMIGQPVLRQFMTNDMLAK